jgi:hypothetical protein
LSDGHKNILNDTIFQRRQILTKPTRKQTRITAVFTPYRTYHKLTISKVNSELQLFYYILITSHTTMTNQMNAPESRILASEKCAEKSKELQDQAQAKGNNDDLDGPRDSSRAPNITSSSTHCSSEDLLFDSLDSVHSTTSTLNILGIDWQDDDDSESDFESSFASLGCDDDDDEEAYREQRNMLAKQTIENAKPRRQLLTKAQSTRRMIREPSFRGTLGLIAE